VNRQPLDVRFPLSERITLFDDFSSTIYSRRSGTLRTDYESNATCSISA